MLNTFNRNKAPCAVIYFIPTLQTCLQSALESLFCNTGFFRTDQVGISYMGVSSTDAETVGIADCCGLAELCWRV